MNGNEKQVTWDDFDQAKRARLISLSDRCAEVTRAGEFWLAQHKTSGDSFSFEMFRAMHQLMMEHHKLIQFIKDPNTLCNPFPRPAYNIDIPTTPS